MLCPAGVQSEGDCVWVHKGLCAPWDDGQVDMGHPEQGKVTRHQSLDFYSTNDHGHASSGLTFLSIVKTSNPFHLNLNEDAHSMKVSWKLSVA